MAHLRDVQRRFKNGFREGKNKVILKSENWLILWETGTQAKKQTTA
jgi:hypothetical protein